MKKCKKERADDKQNLLITDVTDCGGRTLVAQDVTTHKTNIGFDGTRREVGGVFLGTDGKCQRSALILLQQLMPLVDIEVGIASVGVNGTFLGAFHHHIDSLHFIVNHREIEGSNTHRDGNPHIVGIDVGQLVLLNHISWC